MTVRLLQRAETHLALAHDKYRRGDLAAAQEHTRKGLLLVREALADTVAPNPPVTAREE